MEAVQRVRLMACRHSSPRGIVFGRAARPYTERQVPVPGCRAPLHLQEHHTGCARLKTGKFDYVAINERVDKAVKSHGVVGDVYRNHYLQQYWRAMMLEEIECVRIDEQYHTGPVPMSRAMFWELAPHDIGSYPASVRATPPDTEPPWKIVADMPVSLLEPSTSYYFGALGVSAVSIELWENSNLVPPPNSDDVKPQRTRHPVGSPEQYPWDEFYIQIIAIAQTLDGLPTGYGAQAELQRTMLQWCEDNWGCQPSVSWVKARISKLYRQLKLASN